MWQEIVEMFTTMQWYVYVPLILGVILLIAEAFIPSFGIVGGFGLLFSAGGIIAQGIISKSFLQALALILIFGFIVVVVFVFFVRSARFGALSKTPLIENKTAVPVDYSDKKRNLMRPLLGKTGTAITSFRPSGKFEIDKVVYEGITNGEMIEKGELIKIIDVEGIKIRVEKKKK